jgi:hypothetical protein
MGNVALLQTFRGCRHVLQASSAPFALLGLFAIVPDSVVDVFNDLVVRQGIQHAAEPVAARNTPQTK